MNISDTLSKPVAVGQKGDASISEHLLDTAEAATGNQESGRPVSINITSDRFIVSILASKPVSWLVPVAESIQNLASWDLNWDSYGGLSLNPEVLEPTMSVLCRFMKEGGQPPQLSLTPAGGLQLEWRNSEIVFDVEVEPNTKMSSYFCDDITSTQLDLDNVEDIEELAEPFKLLWRESA